MELNVSAGVYAFEVIFLSKKLAANILTRWDRMEIIKKINNNSALARDAKGHEVVVFGKGIGFPPTPYELEDLSKIQRTFYYVDDKYYALLQEVPEEIFLAADDIAEDANEELNCDLNPNLAFILADHLNFAIERTRAGMTLRTPLAYDIRHLYPNEYKLGRSALHMLRDRLKVELPEQEAVSIALHIINAEAENSDMHATMQSAQIITELTEIVEQAFGITLDRDSFNYSRFAMHLRYLVQRMMQGSPLPADAGSRDLFLAVRCQYPEIYTCTRQVSRYLKDRYGWTCTEEEELYLTMHIHRVKSEQQPDKDAE